MGFDIAIYPSIGMNAAAAALRSAYGHLLEHGDPVTMTVPSLSMAELHDLVGFPEGWDFEQRHAGPHVEPCSSRGRSRGGSITRRPSSRQCP